MSFSSPLPTFGAGLIPQPALAPQDDGQVTAPSYVLGSNTPDTKTQLAMARIQASMQNPYYKALTSAYKSGPKFDTSGATNWAQGLLKGMGNLTEGIRYNRQENQEKQDLLNWNKAQQQIAQGEQQAGQQQAATQAQNADWVGQQYGPEQKQLYLMDPTHWTENYTKNQAEQQFAQGIAHDKSVGTGTGENDARQVNLGSNLNLLAKFGVPPDAGDKGVLSPTTQMIYHSLGMQPVDLLNNTQRLYDAQNSGNQVTRGSLENQNLPTKQTLENTGTVLDNQGKVLSNQKSAFENSILPTVTKLDNEIKTLALQGKGLENTGKAQELVDKQAYKDAITQIQDAYVEGRAPSLQDYQNLQRLGSIAGYKDESMAMLKEIQNPKAGQKLKEPDAAPASQAGANGWVALPSGKFYNPVTKQVSDHAPTPVSKPAFKPMAKQQSKPVLLAKPQSVLPDNTNDIMMGHMQSPVINGLNGWINTIRNGFNNFRPYGGQ